LDKNSKTNIATLITSSQITTLTTLAKDVFLKQPMLLEIKAPINIVGDICSQFDDILEYFQHGGLPPSEQYLFLGNYVNRGLKPVETICLLLAFKVKYPNTFYMLRGLHECSSTSRTYGFYDRCKRTYNIKLWKQFIEVFKTMPVAAIINNSIFCCHGGLSPDLHSLDDIRNLQRIDMPFTGLMADLIAAEPSTHVKDWGENWRGMSYSFGEIIVSDFLNKYNFKMICRSNL